MGEGPGYPRKPHKYDELDQIHSAYEKGLRCQEWAEECRRKWYEGKDKAAAGDAWVSGQAHSNSDSFSREYDWKKSTVAQDLVGLEQMYTRWAQCYFAQATAEQMIHLAWQANQLQAG
jgi:hypothetical protein